MIFFKLDFTLKKLCFAQQSPGFLSFLFNTSSSQGLLLQSNCKSKFFSLYFQVTNSLPGAFTDETPQTPLQNSQNFEQLTPAKVKKSITSTSQLHRIRETSCSPGNFAKQLVLQFSPKMSCKITMCKEESRSKPLMPR